ncbi:MULTISPECIES: hypothetical protein [Bacillaceae]|uniref:J domain-containing protein n=1 Tax=Evansella alkalicola TaxID=745819 RepID=A0ABS6JU22_9BACI|nr:MULTISPECIES: hypothetical protein [Bacillaceae]MBU9720747.1 hypothetical protein [Bacillus alkalicola]
MNLNEAYEVLGVALDASEEEIEDKYYTWILRHKNEVDRNKNEETIVDLNIINEAYQVIKKHLTERERSKQVEQNEPVSPIREKLDNLMYHYKYHLIFGVVILFLTGVILHSSIQSWRNQAYLDSLPPADLAITFFGEFYNIDTDRIEENILLVFPEWERVEINNYTTPAEVSSQYDMGERQRSILELMNDDADLFIVDLFHFYDLFPQSVFSPMTPIEDFLEEHVPPEQLLYEKLEHNETDEIYGIDITEHDILQEGNIHMGDGIVLALHSRSTDHENGLDFIKRVIE